MTADLGPPRNKSLHKRLSMLTINRFGIVLAGLLVICGSGPARAFAESKSSHPNIVFLLADDMRFDAMGGLGNPVVKTPNLDTIAKSGTIFRNAYCMGSRTGAVCLPSRNMLLSGRSYFRWAGQFAAGSPPNFPLSLEDLGYETFHHGKRGNVAVEIEKRFNQSHHVQDDQERRTGQPGKTIVDSAIRFLDQRPGEKPFFLYLAFEAPHDPRVAAKEYLDLYDEASILLPKNYMPIHPFNNGEQTVRDELLAPWPRTRDEISRQLREYYAVISGLDHHIGRLIQELKRKNLYDNTILIFSSDNGLSIGSHGLMGKQNIYEPGMKVPLFIAGPGIPRGKSTDALVYLMDLYPTVCELVGAPIPPGLDGVSLASVIRGQSAKVRDSLFLAYRDVQRSVRDDRWKLIRYPRIDRNQLFDLSNDPDEIHDLANESEQKSRIDRMMTLMKEWQAKLGDSTPLTRPGPPQDPRFIPPTDTNKATQ